MQKVTSFDSVSNIPNILDKKNIAAGLLANILEQRVKICTQAIIDMQNANWMGYFLISVMDSNKFLQRVSVKKNKVVFEKANIEEYFNFVIDFTNVIEDNFMNKRALEENVSFLKRGKFLDVCDLMIDFYNKFSSNVSQEERVEYLKSILKNKYVVEVFKKYIQYLKNREIVQAVVMTAYEYENFVNRGSILSVSGKFNLSEIAKIAEPMMKHGVSTATYMEPTNPGCTIEDVTDNESNYTEALGSRIESRNSPNTVNCESDINTAAMNECENETANNSSQDAQEAAMKEGSKKSRKKEKGSKESRKEKKPKEGGLGWFTKWKTGGTSKKEKEEPKPEPHKRTVRRGSLESNLEKTEGAKMNLLEVSPPKMMSIAPLSFQMNTENSPREMLSTAPISYVQKSAQVMLNPDMNSRYADVASELHRNARDREPSRSVDNSVYDYHDSASRRDSLETVVSRKSKTTPNTAINKDELHVLEAMVDESSDEGHSSMQWDYQNPALSHMEQIYENSPVLKTADDTNANIIWKPAECLQYPELPSPYMVRNEHEKLKDVMHGLMSPEMATIDRQTVDLLNSERQHEQNQNDLRNEIFKAGLHHEDTEMSVVSTVAVQNDHPFAILSASTNPQNIDHSAHNYGSA